MQCQDNNSIPDLFSFASALIDDEIIVFGGMRGNYKQTKNLYSIQLDHKRTNYVPPPPVESANFSDLHDFDDNFEYNFDSLEPEGL